MSLLLFLLLLMLFFLPISEVTADVKIAPSQKGKWTSGLVGYWTFDGPDMDWSQPTEEARDQSGQNNHGDVVDDTHAAIGKVGQALSFDGSGDWVDVGDPPILDSISTTDFTISAWVNLASKGQDRDFVGWGYSGSYNGIELRYDVSDDYFEFDMGDTAFRYAKYSQANPSLNTWYHVVGVRDGNTIRIYVDAVEGAVTDTVGTLDVDGGEIWAIGRLGSGYPSYERYFNGLIDEVRIYNRALLQSEIEEIYQAGLSKLQPNTPITDYLTSGLVGHWTFNGPDMDWSQPTEEAHDQSGQNNHGDVIGPIATIGKVGQALEFDGVDDYVSLGNDTSLQLGNVLTLSAWVKPVSGTTRQTVIGQNNTGGAWQLEIGTHSGHIAIIVPGIYVTETTAAIMATRGGIWTHVAYTRSGAGSGTHTIYMNGESYAASDGATNFTAEGNKEIGRRASAVQQFNGLIDEVRIYNRALDPTEIDQLYKIGARKFELQ